MKTKPKGRKFVQIITCCEEAKLTVLGTSYAIWVDTPPMSRIPAVLLRRMASLLSLPGMLTSTIQRYYALLLTFNYGEGEIETNGSNCRKTKPPVI